MSQEEAKKSGASGKSSKEAKNSAKSKASGAAADDGEGFVDHNAILREK